jgi:hypothetical protein
MNTGENELLRRRILITYYSVVGAFSGFHYVGMSWLEQTAQRCGKKEKDAERERDGEAGTFRLKLCPRFCNVNPQPVGI